MTRAPSGSAAPASQPRRRRGPRGSVPLGRIAGMPLHLQSSWLIISFLVVLLYGPVLRRSMPELGLGAYAVALGFCLLLGVSVLLHELAHAGAAFYHHLFQRDATLSRMLPRGWLASPHKD